MSELIRVGKEFAKELRRFRNEIQYKNNKPVSMTQASDIMSRMFRERKRKNEPFMDI